MHLDITKLQALLLAVTILSGSISIIFTALGNFAKAFGKPALASKLLTLGHDVAAFKEKLPNVDPPAPPSASAGFVRTRLLATMSVAAICAVVPVTGCATLSSWWGTEGKAEVLADGITLVEDYAIKGKTLIQIAAELGLDIVEAAKEILKSKLPAVVASPARATAERLRVVLPTVPVAITMAPDAGADAH